MKKIKKKAGLIAIAVCALSGWVQAEIVATATSLDVNFNSTNDYPNNAVFRGFDVGAPNNDLVIDETGGIAGDGALDFTANSRGLNWRQALDGEILSQSLVFTKNDLEASNGQATFFVMGFSTDVDGHVTDPTQGAGSADADAFQLSFYHPSASDTYTLTLREFTNGVNGAQFYSNFDATGTNMLQFDLTLEQTASNTFDWGYTLTDLGPAGAGSTVVASDTKSITSAEFAAALSTNGVYAGMRSANQTGGVLSGLDQWTVVSSNSVPPEPPAPVFEEALLFTDFNNGNYQDVNSFTLGATNNFWSGNSQYSETNSQLVATIDSSGSNYKSANITSNPDGGYSTAFNFFDKRIKLKVRGISFDGTTGTDPTGLPDTKMQQIFSFMGDGTVPGSTQDSIFAEVRADGRVRLKSRIDGSYLGAGGLLDEVTVANMTGFDLTLEPGTTGTDYSLTVYGDSDSQASGSVTGLVKADWGAGDGAAKLGLWAQEQDNATPPAGEFIMVSTVGSYELVELVDSPLVTLVDYGFDQTNASPDVVAANIATNDFTGGTVTTNDATATPIDGPPVIQTAGPDAVLSFTVSPDLTNQVDYSSLSYEIRMYTQTATIERKVEITSSATGTNVLHTLYNFAGWQRDGSDPADDKLGNEWESRTLDLSGISELQDVVGPVTFSFNYIDITPGGGDSSYVFMDAVKLTGRIRDAEVILSPYEAFTALYGLSGTPSDDKDQDGLADYAEYVFGGLPDNAGDQGTQPVFDTAGGDYIYSLIGDTNVTAHVVSTENLVLGPWVTNDTINVSVNNGVLGVYSNSFGTGASQLFIKLELETP